MLWSLPLYFKSHCCLLAPRMQGAPSSFSVLFDGPAVCCLFCGMLFTDSPLFSLQLFPSVSCRRDTPLTCLVRGHLSFHTLTVPHTSPLSSCHTHNIFVLSSEQPFLPRYHVSTLRMIWVILRFVGCLFVLFWQSFVFLMPKCSDRNMNMPKI